MKRGPWMKPIAVVTAIAFALWAVSAYLLLPVLWTHHERQPGLADKPMITRTGQGIPGDPLNVGLVGLRADVVRAMHEAGWYPADPVT
ncbi:MAG: LssY C-terminal domain-containing protein, partial [Pseudorhodoplanes sp.]